MAWQRAYLKRPMSVTGRLFRYVILLGNRFSGLVFSFFRNVLLRTLFWMCSPYRGHVKSPLIRKDASGGISTDFAVA